MLSIIKVLLILVVVGSHFRLKFFSLGSQMAVALFFMISGYLNAKSFLAKDISCFAYCVSRYKRLYIPYIYVYLVCALFAGAFIYLDVSTVRWSSCRLFGTLVLEPWTFKTVGCFLSSLTLFGQDILSLSPDLHKMLPLRQTWFLSALLLFNFMTPYLVKRYHLTVNLCIFFFALKIYLWKNYSWNVAYFPFYSVFGYYLLGHVLSKAEGIKENYYNVLICFLPFIFLGFSSSINKFNALQLVLSTGVLIYFCFIIPKAAKVRIPFESFLGNFSYYLFLVHFLCRDIIKNVFAVSTKKSIGLYSTYLSIGVAVVIALFLSWYKARKMRLRNNGMDCKAPGNPPISRGSEK